MFIVRGLTVNGEEWFYTGRAGSGWVSQEREDAFAYGTVEVARRKALGFNRMTALHGLRFVAVPQDGDTCEDSEVYDYNEV